MSYADDLELRTALRLKFLPKQIGRLPKVEPKDGKKGRPALDFVSHAIVTDRLNFVAPGWTYTIDETFMWEHAYWIRGTITIGDVSRPEFGDGDDPKDALANFICRGAMRFGVALDLWQKQQGEASASSSPARSQEIASTSGRDGEDRGEGEAAFGEGAEKPSPSPQQTVAGPYDPHPNKPHILKDSKTLEGARYCIVKGCDFVLAPEHAKPTRQEA